MTANKRKVKAAQRKIAHEVESGTLSQDFLRGLAKRFGLAETQEAAVACASALEEQRETVIPQRERVLGDRIAVLFSARTAEELGVRLPDPMCAEVH